MNAKLLLLIAAIICFVLVVLQVTTNSNILALGLVFFAASFLPI